MLLRFVTQILLVPVTVQRLGDVLIDKELSAAATVISANRALVTSDVSALILEAS